MSKKIKNIIKGIISVFFVVIIFLLSYFIIANIVAAKNNTISSFFGYSISYVPTTSMEPTITHGSSVLFEKNTKYEDITYDDIIVYYNEESKIYVIHRVYDITNEGLVMKGDNNIAIDTKSDGSVIYVTSSNYVGKYVRTVSEFSINTPFARTIILFISIVAFGVVIASETISIIKAKKELGKNNKDDNDIDQEALKKELLEEIKEEMKNEGK